MPQRITHRVRHKSIFRDAIQSVNLSINHKCKKQHPLSCNVKTINHNAHLICKYETDIKIAVHKNRGSHAVIQLNPFQSMDRSDPRPTLITQARARAHVPTSVLLGPVKKNACSTFGPLVDFTLFSGSLRAPALAGRRCCLYLMPSLYDRAFGTAFSSLASAAFSYVEKIQFISAV